MDEEEKAGSHHGTPELLKRDIELLRAYTVWVETVRDAGGWYSRDWLPSEHDWLKSRLFWRIRSGKKPLKYPPPTCYACPWYELIDLPDEEHTSFEPVRIIEDDGKKRGWVAQCPYDLITEGTLEGPDNAAVVGFGPYRFRVWNGPKEYYLYTSTGEGGTKDDPVVTIQAYSLNGNEGATKDAAVAEVRLTGFIHYIGTEEATKAAGNPGVRNGRR